MTLMHAHKEWVQLQLCEYKRCLVFLKTSKTRIREKKHITRIIFLVSLLSHNLVLTQCLWYCVVAFKMKQL